MAEELIIFQKTYDLVKEIYPVINMFPKNNRQVLGKQIEETCILVLILVIKANKSRDKQRAMMQGDISDNLDCLRIMIRLSKDLRLVSIKRYLALAEKLNEIGKMVYCWSRV